MSFEDKGVFDPKETLEDTDSYMGQDSVGKEKQLGYKRYGISRTKNMGCNHWGTCGKLTCVLAYYGVPFKQTPLPNSEDFAKLSAEERKRVQGLHCQTPGCGKIIEYWEYYAGWHGALYKAPFVRLGHSVSDAGIEQADNALGAIRRLAESKTTYVHKKDIDDGINQRWRTERRRQMLVELEERAIRDKNINDGSAKDFEAVLKRNYRKATGKPSVKKVDNGARVS